MLKVALIVAAIVISVGAGLVVAESIVGFGTILPTLAGLATTAATAILFTMVINEFIRYEKSLYEEDKREEHQENNLINNNLDESKDELEQDDDAGASIDSEIFSLKHKTEKHYLP